MKSITGFAENYEQKKRACSICELKQVIEIDTPEGKHSSTVIAEINRAMMAGIGYAVIREWLLNEVKMKPQVVPSSQHLYLHKQRGHCEKPA